MIADVAEALRFAHANGVLHLDVKPENVLVTRDGLAKVADFGVARLTDAAGSARAVAGTPGFMAPEQLRGEPLDERADVWSVGALAYLMLTGREPFPARTPGDALARIEAGEPVPPSRVDRGLRPEVDDVVFVALAADPDHRQPSAAVFADEILALLPDPAHGRQELAEDVAQMLEDEEEAPEEPGGEPRPVGDRGLVRVAHRTGRGDGGFARARVGGALRPAALVARRARRRGTRGDLRGGRAGPGTGPRVHRVGAGHVRAGRMDPRLGRHAGARAASGGWGAAAETRP